MLFPQVYSTLRFQKMYMQDVAHSQQNHHTVLLSQTIWSLTFQFIILFTENSKRSQKKTNNGGTHRWNINVQGHSCILQQESRKTVLPRCRVPGMDTNNSCTIIIL